PPVVAALAKHGRPVRPAKRKRAARTDLDALYAEIVAAPEDDAPRMVYADALLERGDSRGTFIQAQLAAPADPKAGATILRKDEKQWIGDVARISKNRVWRRGFLDELQLLQGAVADPETWQRATTNPALATLRTLHKETASEALYATFVNSRTLVNLRDFEVPSRKFAEHLVRLARPGITHLELGFRISAESLALVDQLVARLGVTRFAIMTAHDVPASLDIVEHWANRTQLTELTLVPVPGRFQDWRAGAPTWLAATKRLGIPRLGAFAYDTRMFSS
ncbi:MAG TPA: TIGR02996 domain-containing protein, partial [Kofleriaceae bacterium]